MPARRTPPTRHSLLRVTEELETLHWGLDVLERRRDGLVMLMQSLLARYEETADRLGDAFAAARRTRTAALELDGIAALDSAALAREDHAELLVLSRELQGLPIPLVLGRGISKRLDQRGYGILGSGSTIDETAASHEAVLELVVGQAELHLSLRILLVEIRRLNVRVNALRHKLLPDLEDTKRSIEFHLAEREREERLIQRFVKRKREQNRTRPSRQARDRPED